MAKIASKMSFPFNFAKIEKGRHLTVSGSKKVETFTRDSSR